MSEPIQNTPSPCDQALDYLYEMLDGEDKARFLAHLATCARCQAELEAFGRVREVAKATMPTVEPSERLAGALHQQLMHEAAQRKPQGKLLPFVRRVIRHPAYAAAAGILIVGGAVALQASRDKLLMPALAPPATQAPVEAAPAAEPPAAAAPAPATPPPAAPAEGDARELKAVAVDKADRRPRAEEPEPRTRSKGSLDELSTGESLAGGKGGGGLGSGRGGLAQDKAKDYDGRQAMAPPPPLAKSAAPTSKQAPSSTLGQSAPAAPSAVAAAPSVGAAGPSPVQAAPMPSRPAPRSAPTQRMVAPADDEGSAFAKKESVADVAPKAAEEKRAVRTENQAPEVERSAKNLAEDSLAQHATAGAAQKADTSAANRDESPDAIDAQRRRAGELAQAGRCEEAASVYRALDNKVPDRLSAQDRLSYARCLRMLGRLDPAQGELDQLRVNKQQLPGSALNAEQQALDLERRKAPTSTGERRAASKSKKAARAIDSPEPAPKPAATPAKPAY